MSRIRSGTSPVRRGGRALVGVAVAGSLIAPALSSSSASASSSAGTLNWYGAASVNTWDPALNSVGNDVKTLSLVYSGLTNMNTKGVAVPELASKWSYSKNGLELTFTLRPHLTFTDGTPVNAQAVKVNLDRARTNPKSLVASLLTSIKSETVVSPLVVRINLKTPDWELPGTLAGKAGELVSPKALANPTTLATHPVGAGPFKLTKYVAQGYTDLVKNPGYWNAKAIKIQAIDQNNNTTAASVLAAVQSGQSNYAQIASDQVAGAKAAGFDIHLIQQFQVEYVGINQGYAPFKGNPNLVQAIGYMLNRKALLQTLNNGIGKVDDEPFPTTYFGYDPSPSVVNRYSYNPTKAKQLLTKAGYPGGKGLSFAVTTSLPSPTAEALQSQFESFGAKVSIKAVPSTETTQLEYVEHNVPFFNSGFVGRESPLTALQIIYGPTGLLNPSRTTTPAVNKALATLQNTPETGFEQFQTAVRNVVQAGVSNSSVDFLYQAPMILATKGVSGIKNYIDFQEFTGVTASGS